MSLWMDRPAPTLHRDGIAAASPLLNRLESVSGPVSQPIGAVVSLQGVKHEEKQFGFWVPPGTAL